MVVDRFVNGDILTAGSLNTVLGNRMGMLTFDGATYASNSSGTEITLHDYYVTSGACPSNNRLLVMMNCAIAGSNANSNIFNINIGPSGTSPSLTVIGQVSKSTSVTDALTVFGCGSTSIDTLGVPALVRLSVNAPSAAQTKQIFQYVVFGVYP